MSKPDAAAMRAAAAIKVLLRFLQVSGGLATDEELAEIIAFEFPGYKEMREALERFVDTSNCGDHCTNSCAYCQARAALQKARLA